MAALSSDDINIRIQSTASNEGINSASSSVGKLDEATGKVASSSKLAGIATQAFSVAAGFAIAEVGAKAIQFAKDSVKAYSDYQAAQAQVAQVLDSTGNKYKFTQSQLDQLTQGLMRNSVATKQQTLAAESMLLQFDNLNKNQFPQILQLSADLAARFGGDLKDKAFVLGRALQDPLEATRALKAAGIPLKLGLDEQIKSMMAAGNIAGAQKLIMDQLTQRVGGAAEAYGKTFPGEVAKAKRALEDFQINAITKVKGALNNIDWEKVTADLRQFYEAASKIAERIFNYLEPSFIALGNEIRKMMPQLKILWNDVLKPLAEVFGVVLVLAIKSWLIQLDILLHVFADLIQWGADAGRDIQKAWRDVGKVFKDVGQVFSMLRDLFTGGDPTLGADHVTKGWIAVDKVFVSVRETAIRAINDIKNFWDRGWSDVKRIFTDTFHAIEAAITQFREHTFEDIGYAIGFIITLPVKLVAAFVVALYDLTKLIYETFVHVYEIINTAVTKAVQWIEGINWVNVFVGIGRAIEGAGVSIWNAITSWFNSTIRWVSSINWGGIFSGIGRAIWGVGEDIWNAVKRAFDRISSLNWGGIMSGIARSIGNDIINLIQGALNGALSGIPGHPHVTIPHFAQGVNNFAGGLAVVGENGPELAYLPKGTSIIPNNQMGSMSNNQTVTIGTVVLSTPGAVDQFFKKLDMDTTLVSKGMTANRGTI